MPTLAEGNTQNPIVGTSHHQDQLAQLAKQAPHERYSMIVTAELSLVTSGQWAGAVAVSIGGQRVGSISSERSARYRPLLEELAAKGTPATCRGVIVGGHLRDDGSQGYYGFALQQPSQPALAPKDAPFLPPVVGMCTRVADSVLDELNTEIPSRAKRFTQRLVGSLESRTWTLSLGGRQVGTLEYSDEADLALIRAAEAAGFPLTCHVRMVREPERLRVAVDLPL